MQVVNCVQAVTQHARGFFPARNIAHVTVIELPPLGIANRFTCCLVDIQANDLRAQFQGAANNRRSDARRCAGHNDVFPAEVIHFHAHCIFVI